VRIAYAITRADAVGGASIHVRDLAAAMRERGHEVLVLVGGRGPVTEQLETAGVPFRRLDFCRRAINPVIDARGIAEMARIFGEWQPDLVSTHTAKAGWIGRAAAARAGIPAIYTPHGWSIAGRIWPSVNAAFTLAERIAARWTRAIVCVSEYERELALSRGVAPPELLHVVHNGVRDVPQSLRAVPGRTPVRICSVARFEAPKDYARLLGALALVRSLEWEADFVGDGPLEAAMRRRAEKLGISGRVRFHGYLPDAAPVLAGAQVFALASTSEGFPRSVLEGMRAGLPVVASDVGGVGEAVEQGVTGFMAPAGATSTFAIALGALIGDRALRERMGAAGRRAYEETFRLEAMVEKTAAIYAEVTA
jgi:glycosyltransferase involved in cell wall biosynthesis